MRPDLQRTGFESADSTERTHTGTESFAISVPGRQEQPSKVIVITGGRWISREGLRRQYAFQRRPPSIFGDSVFADWVAKSFTRSGPML